MYSDVTYAVGFGLGGAILFLLVDKYEKNAVVGNLLKFSVLAVLAWRSCTNCLASTGFRSHAKARRTCWKFACLCGSCWRWKVSNA